MNPTHPADAAIDNATRDLMLYLAGNRQTGEPGLMAHYKLTTAELMMILSRVTVFQLQNIVASERIVKGTSPVPPQTPNYAPQPPHQPPQPTPAPAG